MIYFVTNQSSVGEYDKIEPASVQDVLSYFRDKEEIQVDTETEGFDPFTKNLLLMQLGDRDNQFVIDCTTVDIEAFKNLLEDKSKILLLHNSKFDLRFLYKRGIIPFENIYDTYLAERIISCGIDSHKKSLEACAYRYLKVTLPKDIRGAIHKLGPYNSRVIEYAANDVKYLQDIRRHQLEKLKSLDLLNALKLENSFVSVLAYVEYCGVGIDVEGWKEKSKKDRETLLELEEELNQMVEALDNPTYLKAPDLFNPNPSCGLNWSSSKQLIPLFKELGLDLTTVDKKTKIEKDSIEAKILKPQQDKHPIVAKYLAYKKQEKLVSTYGLDFLRHINPVTGRIHTNFNQIMNTYRLSSGKADPKRARPGEVNMQNIPRGRERTFFIPANGNAFGVRDYSGQETRVLAELSGDKDYLDYSTNPEKDLHCLSATLLRPDIKNLSVAEIKAHYPEVRQQAKSISFAIPYGGNGATIAINLSLPISEGERIYKGFMSHFPHLNEYFEKVKEQTINQGYVLINTLTGGKSFFPQTDQYQSIKERLESYVGHQNPSGRTFKGLSNEFWKFYTHHKSKQSDTYIDLKAMIAKYFRLQGSMERSGLNYPVQGTSAKMSKLAGIYFYRWILENNLWGTVKICVPLHDKILLCINLVNCWKILKTIIPQSSP